MIRTRLFGYTAQWNVLTAFTVITILSCLHCSTIYIRGVEHILRWRGEKAWEKSIFHLIIVYSLNFPRLFQTHNKQCFELLISKIILMPSYFNTTLKFSLICDTFHVIIIVWIKKNRNVVNMNVCLSNMQRFQSISDIT